MQRILSTYDRITHALSGTVGEGIALLLTRVALAGVFWRAGRTKVVDGTALQIDETQYFLFEEFGLPLSPEIMVPITTYAEHLFPVLLVVGLFTRLSALALLVMTMVIQFFVFPDAWWSVHLLWTAMAAILIARGPGLFSLDAVLAKTRKTA